MIRKRGIAVSRYFAYETNERLFLESDIERRMRPIIVRARRGFCYLK